MKTNKLKLLILILVMMVFALALVACNTDPKPDTPSDDDKGDGIDPIPTTFVVTFDSNGGDISYPNQEVSYGGLVANPNGGNVDNNPVKTGYTFRYWADKTNDTVEWLFSSNTITANTTLIAIYQANTYVHTLDINNSNANAKIPNDVTTFTSTYNSSTSMPVPTCRDADGNVEDQFLYWYYEDAQGKEVRFSYWLSFTIQTASNVHSSSTNYFTREGIKYSLPAAQPISSADFDKLDVKYYVQNTLNEANNFTIGRVLTLKAKWYSQLPTTAIEDNPISAHKVSFISDGGTNVDPVMVRYNDTLEKPEDPTKADYDFAGWYIAKEADNGKYELDGKKYDITYEEFDFDGGIGDPTFDYITADMVFVGTWTRSYTVASAADWDTLINKINYDEDASEEEIAEANELLGSKIKLTADITISNAATIKGNFSGEFDGQYDDGGILKNHVLVVEYTAYTPTTRYVALFEKVSGKIKHIDIVYSANLILLDTVPDTAFETSTNKAFYIASLAATTDNATIQHVNIDASITIEDSGANSYADIAFYVGGLIASATKTEITGTWAACGSITLNNAAANTLGKDIKAGLIAGYTYAGLISQGTINQKLDAIGANINVNASGSAYVGGLVGQAEGTSISTIQIVHSTSGGNYKVANIQATAKVDAYAGTIVGASKYSSISKSSVSGTIANPASIQATGNKSYAGGLTGLNQGTIKESYIREFNVATIGALEAFSGGLAGTCKNDSTGYTVGRIEYSYASNFLTEEDTYSSTQDAVMATNSSATGVALAGGLTGDATGCSIVRSFAYVSCTTNIEAGGTQGVGYLTGRRDAKTDMTNCYSDIESKGGLGGNFPKVAIKVKYSSTNAYVYNYDELDPTRYIEVNGVLNTSGNTSFKSGSFIYSTLGWSNSTWNLYNENAGQQVFVNTLPEFRG